MAVLPHVTVEDTLDLYKVKKVTCSLSQGVCLLTKSKTSTSSTRARPPPPVRSPPEQLKGEAESLGTGDLWCQDGPETEAGDQGPAAPDQRTRNPWLKELMEESC